MRDDHSPYRKAAILASALDAEAVVLLLAEMPSEVAAEVRREMGRLGEIDDREQQAIVDEFVRGEGLPAELDPPGLELTDELARTIAAPNALRGRDALGAAPSRRTPDQPLWVGPAFQTVETVDLGTLANVLEMEHPQIIAVVIANLSAHRAGDVLARLPAAIQADVIRRLTGLEPARREVLDEIEQLVMARVQQHAASSRASGLATVSVILNSADETARRQILSNLARHDRPLAGKLNTPPKLVPQFSFDEVCRIGGDGLLRVVQAAAPEVVVLAFAGADAELVAKLVDCLPPGDSQRFARGIAELGPTRLADIESAQTSLAELAGQLAAAGRLHGGPPIHLTAVA
ncbi:MAG: hypothetical protein IT427_06355 [Pirellulales bacterium]|nr:hypothetical protein [Pirellulales bacterium]